MITFWQNRAANGHALIVTIDAKSDTGEQSEWAFSLIIEK
jgi:hypothetical protein